MVDVNVREDYLAEDAITSSGYCWLLGFRAEFPPTLSNTKWGDWMRNGSHMHMRLNFQALGLPISCLSTRSVLEIGVEVIHRLLLGEVCGAQE